MRAHWTTVGNSKRKPKIWKGMGCSGLFTERYDRRHSIKDYRAVGEPLLSSLMMLIVYIYITSPSAPQPCPPHVCSQLHHPELRHWGGRPLRCRSRWRSCNPRNNRCLLRPQFQRQGVRLPQAAWRSTLPRAELLPTATRLHPVKPRTKPRKGLLLQHTSPQYRCFDWGGCSPIFLLQPAPQLRSRLQYPSGGCERLSPTVIEHSIDLYEYRYHGSLMRT